MRTFRNVLWFISVIVFCLVSFELARFQNLIHPNSPYKTTLVSGDYKKNSDRYVSVGDVKNGVADISVEENGSYLLREGEVAQVGNRGFSLIGPKYKGEVKVASIEGDTVILSVDIKRLKGFYIFYGLLGNLFSMFLSYVFYSFFLYIGKFLVWMNQRLLSDLEQEG